MRKDAEAHAEEDKQAQGTDRSPQHADNTVYAAEKALREFGDKVPAEVKTEIEAKVTEVEDAWRRARMWTAMKAAPRLWVRQSRRSAPASMNRNRGGRGGSGSLVRQRRWTGCCGWRSEGITNMHCEEGVEPPLEGIAAAASQ
jgi:hypothetical protein